MKKFTILLTIVILVVATVLSGCGNSAQKYFKYDMFLSFLFNYLY